jgi:SEC-C motif-containing protein
MASPISIDSCRCCSGKQYQDCCAPIINDPKQATDAEQLMRSRYTAFTQDNMSHIKSTMTGNALKEYQSDKKSSLSEKRKWVGLVIHSSKTLKKKGYVDFTATFYRDGIKLNIREQSVFKKIEDRWFYVDRLPE